LPICPHCGFESGHGTLECPLCGTRLLEVAVARPDQMPAGSVAWEDPSVAFPASLFRTWRDSLFKPAAFFRRLAWDDSLARPLLYYLLVSIISAFFVLLWRSTDAPLLPAAFGPDAPLAPLVQFFFEPFAALIGLGIGVLVLQLFAIILAPARRGMRASCAIGSISSSAMSAQANSSPWPNHAASSASSAPGFWTRPADRFGAGTTRGWTSSRSP